MVLHPLVSLTLCGIVVATLVQNIHRGHYEIAADTDPQLRLAAAFTELAHAV
ncbi:hypothetical protein Franean1_4638 [Parafrankia sp. EAN1pec]|nr:hypothetical protein Franean1_4638 [Frankia sp. EAN1pec]